MGYKRYGVLQAWYDLEVNNLWQCLLICKHLVRYRGWTYIEFQKQALGIDKEIQWPYVGDNMTRAYFSFNKI
jgi:hypothetical protein